MRHLISVEHHTGWHTQVKEQLAKQGISNVDYRLIPLDHPESAPERSTYEQTPAYVATISELPDESLDFVVVDGHYRSNCILASIAKLKPGGLLLVDDTNLWQNNAPPVPPDWQEVNHTTNGLKFTVIWRKPE